MLLCSTAFAAPIGHTQNGPVTGFTSGSLDEFLGIRYAAPPVGDLRWQPTQPVPADIATHQALAFGPHCAQLASAYGIASTAEDCLYLNIYRPHGAVGNGKKALPVMFWIHGGALVVGESDDYGPAPLIAANNVIVVTINYRLGYLGYLAETGLDQEGHTSANYGLMDQQFALNWVNRNIAGFGGDPNNITVFGESAGGLSTWSNVVSPTSHGLFQKAIVESGAYAIQLPSLAQAETAGNAIAAAVGCSDTDTACLRAVPVATILAQQSSPTLSLTTIVDGTTLPLSINAAIKGAAVVAEYHVTNYKQPVLALGAVLTDYGFACPADLLDHWAVRYTPLFAYEFNDRRAPEDFLPQAGYPFGASHASEIQFLYDITKLPGTRALTPAEQALSSDMTQYWTNFAVTGSPSSPNVPGWARYIEKSNNMQSLAPSGPYQETDFSKVHHCRFWAPVINPGSK